MSAPTDDTLELARKLSSGEFVIVPASRLESGGMLGPSASEQLARTRGLIGYEGLRERLAIDGKLPCLRTVKSLVEKFRGVIRPVELGHRMVGFRESRVEAFLEAMEGAKRGGLGCARKPGSLQL